MRLRGIHRVLTLILALGFFATIGQGASAIWSTTAVDNHWSNGANWMSGHPPNPGDDLTFPAESMVHSMTNDLTDGISIVAMTFQGAGYVMAGNSVTLGELLCGSGVSGLNEVDLPLTLNSTVVFGISPGCTVALNNVVSGPGGVLSTGGGTLILDAVDSYTGVTEAGATGGVLIINATLSGTSSVTVNESSGNPLLGGHGSFTAPLVVNNAFSTDTAFVSPGQGSSAGTLNTGNATFGSTGTRTVLALKLNGTLPGASYDQLNVTGTVTLTHAFLQVSLGFTPANDTQFTIIKNNGGSAVSGTFFGLAEGAKFLVGTTTFQITYVGGSGHDVVLTVVPSEAVATAIAVDPAGNGVLEPGETATLQPTWMNSSGSSMSLSGSASLFTGPDQPGTVFTISDSTADYGTIADGGSAACSTDCYGISISAPGRPAQHWDTRIDEEIAPFSVIKTWTLHVGSSFNDVATDQPFYPFIEKLFHNGVTGGCAGGGYCPANPVTRAQMAVFLLKGEHGSSYLPPPCSISMFTDVPCPTAPFVDWINQLASESITGGCGGGKFCPGNSVTRGQMAVFLLKGEHGGTYVPPPCTSTLFTDVPCPGAQFVNFINELATEGITGGCGGGLYCPGNAVNRGQMAVFLDKAFKLVLYGP